MPAAMSWRGAWLVISPPSYRMRPARTGSIPNMALKAVDLPEPFGPITVVIAPRRTPKDSPCRIVSRP
jgi:hypothetical protein